MRQDGANLSGKSRVVPTPTGCEDGGGGLAIVHEAVAGFCQRCYRIAWASTREKSGSDHVAAAPARAPKRRAADVDDQLPAGALCLRTTDAGSRGVPLHIRVPFNLQPLPAAYWVPTLLENWCQHTKSTSLCTSCGGSVINTKHVKVGTGGRTGARRPRYATTPPAARERSPSKFGRTTSTATLCFAEVQQPTVRAGMWIWSMLLSALSQGLTEVGALTSPSS